MTSITRQSVLALLHGRKDSLGAIGPALREAGLTPHFIRSAAGEEVPQSLGDAAGLIVMGGPMSVYEYERYPHLQAEMRLLEAALAANRPVLGICLGSQLLAHVLGAKVFKNRQQEIGWQPLQFSPEALADPLWHAAPADFVAFHWHGDTYDLPANTLPLASSAITPCQGFRYGSSAYGLQFHLEVNSEVIERIARGNLADLTAQGSSLEQLRQETAEHLPQSLAVAERFFRGWARLASS